LKSIVFVVSDIATFSFSTQTEDVNIECESYKSTSYSPHITR